MCMNQLIKNLPEMWETWVRSLGWEDPLEKGKATHSGILAWRIPWTLQSMGLLRVFTTDSLSFMKTVFHFYQILCLLRDQLHFKPQWYSIFPTKERVGKGKFPDMILHTNGRHRFLKDGFQPVSFQYTAAAIHEGDKYSWHKAFIHMKCIFMNKWLPLL